MSGEDLDNVAGHDEDAGRDQDEGDQGGTFVDYAFARWMRTTPRFVLDGLARADRGLRVSPDVLRIGAPFIDELRAILAHHG